MRRSSQLCRCTLILCGLLLPMTSSTTLAEVSADDRDTDVAAFFIAMRSAGGGEDPGPWPAWRPIRDRVSDQAHLNPEGEANLDGNPAFAIHPHTGNAVVTWAWFDGQDYEVVLSTWDGNGWTPWELLTDNTVNDLDPRVAYSSDGQRQICWWNDGSTGDGIDEAWHRQQDPLTDLWSEPELVSQPGGNGLYPDVTPWGDAWIYASYQLDEGAGEGPHRVMVTWRERNGAGFNERHEIALSEYTGELPEPGSKVGIQARIHTDGRKLWVDWIQNHDQMGYSVYEDSGDWSIPSYIDYRPLVNRAGSFEAGLDMARQDVRRRVAN